MLRSGILITTLLIASARSCVGCDLEDAMMSAGLVDISSIDSSIRVENYNATTHNMLGENTYGCLTKCYLRTETATKVVEAQSLLTRKHPGYSLKALEGTRPRRVQRRMYAVVKNTAIRAYVANPEKGSMHNFGTAVDITIVDSSGRELDFGKPDPRTKIVGKSDWEIKAAFLFSAPNAKQQRNRELLRSTMVAAGFIPLAHEWWHFEAFEKTYVRAHFAIVE